MTRSPISINGGYGSLGKGQFRILHRATLTQLTLPSIAIDPVHFVDFSIQTENIMPTLYASDATQQQSFEPRTTMMGFKVLLLSKDGKVRSGPYIRNFHAYDVSGMWSVPIADPRICVRGWHFCQSIHNISSHIYEGSRYELWLVEAEAPFIGEFDKTSGNDVPHKSPKVAAHRIRFIKRISGIHYKTLIKRITKIMEEGLTIHA